MRTLRIALATSLALWTACLVDAPGAFAQAVVTFRGSVQSLDSSRANVVVRSGGQDRLVVLPATVPVTMQGQPDRRMGVNALMEGTVITVTAVKSPNGQLTARRVEVAPSIDGSEIPTGPTPANKVSVRPSRGATGGVVVTSDTETVNPASGPQFAAARANLGNQSVGEVHVNGRTVFRFRGVRGEDPYVRARTVVSRLNSPGMANLQPSDIRVQRVGGQYAVTARGVTLITADAQTARTNDTTPARLAALWAANIRGRLGE